MSVSGIFGASVLLLLFAVTPCSVTDNNSDAAAGKPHPSCRTINHTVTRCGDGVDKHITCTVPGNFDGDHFPPGIRSLVIFHFKVKKKYTAFPAQEYICNQ
ncbi:hypothetical protein BV898_09202 [Hypsibius exemplaris]|uniref:Uncharacterized protein n=1 Tax=Hypsibius exemplaris TaxID=2072580 RepID=A0A1W0WN99_HYPEX|nr:hypothetical protein BV898_09202 [Hypsibius exemplaris]